MDSTVGRQVGAPFWITLPDRERQSQQEVCNRRRGGVLAEDLGQDTKYSVGGLQPEVGLYVCDVNSLKTFPRERATPRGHQCTIIISPIREEFSRLLRLFLLPGRNQRQRKE